MKFLVTFAVLLSVASLSGCGSMRLFPISSLFGGEKSESSNQAKDSQPVVGTATTSSNAEEGNMATVSPNAEGWKITSATPITRLSDGVVAVPGAATNRDYGQVSFGVCWGNNWNCGFGPWGWWSPFGFNTGGLGTGGGLIYGNPNASVVVPNLNTNGLGSGWGNMQFGNGWTSRPF